MKIKDILYGEFNIEEKVIIDLLKSKPMERIKHVSQQGIPKEFAFNKRAATSRYEHCVGVMLLLRKLDAPLEEQVSGLLHDVSHTPFSHTIDMVLGDYSKQSIQDSLHKKYFQHGEIPYILKANGFIPSRIMKEELFKLLERKAPALCADRVDYSLRDAAYLKISNAKELAKHIIVHKNEIMYDSKKYAIEYGKLFVEQLEKSYYYSKKRSGH